MLPNRFALTQQTEEKLKREKLRTGVSPNILARELFFRSIEKGLVSEPNNEITFGKMVLEKTVWLGELEKITEEMLKHYYGQLEKNRAARIWALHVQSAI
ncbi:DNA sulfur modification protein DndE [Halomonas fontilapidosi]|uniref:DNA sulfur modification protein DndE n=1 Tax=Halomonas fontilapidosi TaxID=616675 RepID=A0A7W5DN29_9GAMM|nr:DndE family protein [Halomonas fontilapidosi]MBB3185499.1 DNA sulfur modification protein DndE [Halomonas fontilapidosi]